MTVYISTTIITPCMYSPQCRIIGKYVPNVKWVCHCVCIIEFNLPQGDRAWSANPYMLVLDPPGVLPHALNCFGSHKHELLLTDKI